MPDVSTNQGIGNTVSSYSINLFRQGIAYMESDKYSEALLCFEQVYKTDGQIPNLHYACAVAFMKLGRKNDALRSCRSEIAKNPDHRDAIALLNKLIYYDKLSWPERIYLVNHEYRFVYCPTCRAMSTNMRKAILKILGLHEKHGHSDDGRTICEVHKHVFRCANKECGFNTNLGTALQILNDDSYFKFTIVRNPWSRLVSGYLSKLIGAPNYWFGIHNERIQQIRNENKLSDDVGKSVTFRQFAEHVVRKSDMEMYDHWRPQVCFIAGHKFDFIAKFEHIQEDIKYINNKLGLNFELFNKNSIGFMKKEVPQGRYFCDCYAEELMAIKKNCGGFPDYKHFYPPELKELVARRYACDIEAFGYDF